METQLVRLPAVSPSDTSRAQALQIEYAWCGSESVPEKEDHPTTPLMVFLHEGLGSVSMWRNFPTTLCAELGCRGLIYSRPGYGQSTPRGPNEHWGPDFMHRQAQQVLPLLLETLGIDLFQTPVWLFGHSDGGSIALLAAAHLPALKGLIVLAPHLFVEDISVNSIEKARTAYADPATGLRQRLSRYHADVDSAFWGWNTIWLHPEFRNWCITQELTAIRCPVLAVQGRDDEYGTLAQIQEIAKILPTCDWRAIDDCGHSPHKDQPQVLIQLVKSFFQQHQQPLLETNHG